MRERILSTLDMGNAADTFSKPKGPLRKETAGNLPARTPGGPRESQADQACQLASCGSGLRQRRSVPEPADPQKKAWNDCPNPDVPGWQGRLCKK